MHSALVRPMSSAARNAPGIDPRPPTTVTTNASAMIARSMPRLAGSRGSCSAPARPARNAPSANTAVKSFASSMPSAAVSTAVLRRRADQDAEARARDEPRERDQHQRADGDQEEVVLRDRAAEELERAGESRRARSEQVFGAPDRQHRVAHDQHDGERRRELQQFRRRVEALQQQRFDQRADERRPRARRARRRARTKPRRVRTLAARKSPKPYAQYAPSMYSEPCAKLTMRVTPKISVRPAATRNSAEADDRPFSNCSRNDASVTRA